MTFFSRQGKNLKFIFFICGLASGFFLYAAYDYVRRPSPVEINSAVGEQITDLTLNALDHVIGRPQADKIIFVYNDLDCPYCRDYNKIIDQLISARDDLKVVWRHFPLSGVAASSFNTALAAECAGAQDKFWPFVLNLSSADANGAQANIAAAEKSGLDLETWNSCLDAGLYQARVEADYYQGIMGGVIGAPASFIQGRYYPGLLPLERLDQLLDQ